MGYEVEWRVINAADYGMPQQRNRVFILAYRTPWEQEPPLKKRRCSIKLMDQKCMVHRYENKRANIEMDSREVD